MIDAKMVNERSKDPMKDAESALRAIDDVELSMLTMRHLTMMLNGEYKHADTAANAEATRSYVDSILLNPHRNRNGIGSLVAVLLPVAREFVRVAELIEEDEK